ncbi:hypothetical protein LG3211_5217 [Lysobacter gummosus]|nr:hypothetical protein LG3211_5217 [Lysobacter gummosus]
MVMALRATAKANPPWPPFFKGGNPVGFTVGIWECSLGC